ncbi:hypothetical protein NPIL_245971 [Nephila pilipes]|uniref:Uncharacterized protein n=1 Tax=Nephila pilipes TaxID=299642 RepID=A0A8X6MDW5_NEPPI|nr:hypothetical protein NPIL_245971 [Nephila pilipes]
MSSESGIRGYLGRPFKWKMADLRHPLSTTHVDSIMEEISMGNRNTCDWKRKFISKISLRTLSHSGIPLLVSVINQRMKSLF